jgi:hypothetical protein
MFSVPGNDEGFISFLHDKKIHASSKGATTAQSVFDFIIKSLKV